MALIPDDDGTFFPQSILGYAKAMEFSLTGRIVPADEALTRSPLNDLMKVEAPEEETEKLARSIAANSPIAVSMIKKTIRQAHKAEIRSNLGPLAPF